jgi:hypothetical protein
MITYTASPASSREQPGMRNRAEDPASGTSLEYRFGILLVREARALEMSALLSMATNEGRWRAYGVKQSGFSPTSKLPRYASSTFFHYALSHQISCVTGE